MVLLTIVLAGCGSVGVPSQAKVISAVQCLSDGNDATGRSAYPAINLTRSLAPKGSRFVRFTGSSDQAFEGVAILLANEARARTFLDTIRRSIPATAASWAARHWVVVTSGRPGSDRAPIDSCLLGADKSLF
jgi:hypothetical protein